MADLATVLPERVVRRLVPSGECLIWTGALQSNGYGYTRWKVDGAWKNVRVHRLVFEVMNGPITSGLEIDHACKQRACANPSHLRAVTHQENLLTRRPRPSSAAITCRFGHPYVVTATGQKKCPTCAAAATRRYRARRQSHR